MSSSDSILHAIRLQKSALIVRNKQPTELRIGMAKLDDLNAEMRAAIDGIKNQPASPHTEMLRASFNEWPERVMSLDIIIDSDPLRLAVE